MSAASMHRDRLTL